MNSTSVIFGAFACAFAFPALAQDAGDAGTAVVQAASFQTVCAENLCVRAPDAPVVELSARPANMVRLADAPTLWALDGKTRARGGMPSLSRDFGDSMGMTNTQTVFGSIKTDSASAADKWLGTERAGMISHNDAAEPVDGVAGFGIVSKF